MGASSPTGGGRSAAAEGKSGDGGVAAAGGRDGDGVWWRLPGDPRTEGLLWEKAPPGACQRWRAAADGEVWREAGLEAVRPGDP